MVVINEKGEESTYTWEKANIYMVDKPSGIINPGNLLNSITKLKIVDKYLTEITIEDKEKIEMNEDDVIEFIVNSLN